MPNEPMQEFRPVGPIELLAEMKKSFIEAYASLGQVKPACDMSGITSRQAYSWRAADPEFARAWDETTRNHVVPMLEQAAIERATDKSDLLLMFLLKAYKREMYDDRMASPPAPPDTGLTLVFNEVTPDTPVQHATGPDGSPKKP